MTFRWSLALCTALVSTAAFAQPRPAPTIAPQQVQQVKTPPRVPGDLGLKRQSAFNAALTKVAGLPPLTIPVPPAYAKVTPVAPSTNGARITQVGTSLFLGASSQTPDGALIIDGAPATPAPLTFSTPAVYTPPVPKGVLDIELVVENGKLYFVDCRAVLELPLPGLSDAIVFGRASSTAKQELTPEDGHYIYAFRAASGRETINLRFKNLTRFFGCEITKAG